MELIQPDYGLVLWSIFSICVLFFLVLAIVSISKSDKDSDAKLLWLLVVIFLPLIGTLVYFFKGRSHRINNNQSSRQ